VKRISFRNRTIHTSRETNDAGGGALREQRRSSGSSPSLFREQKDNQAPPFPPLAIRYTPSALSSAISSFFCHQPFALNTAIDQILARQ
jgi:hypothetical protein